MENDSLVNDVRMLISLKREGEYWDFKEKHHKNKADLLHDIICMANNRADRDAYIIFGVNDNYEIVGVEKDENRKNQQGLIDFMRSKKFGGGIRPTIELQTMTLDNKQIDILVIKNSTDTPFFITEDYLDKKRRVRANYMYTRVGDTNTDIDKSADINHIEYLWKKRFLLNRSPFEQIKQRLKTKNEWVRNEREFYHVYNPEFTISLVPDDERGSPEFYSYLMYNPSTSYGTLSVKYFGTTLYVNDYMVLDSGRYLTAVPQWGSIKDRKINKPYYYKFFIEDSMEYVIHEFLLSDNHEAIIARDALYSGILIYGSTLEKELFENYLNENLCYIHKLVEEEKSRDSFEWMDSRNEREKAINKERIIVGKIFNYLLEKFRSKNLI